MKKEKVGMQKGFTRWIYNNKLDIGSIPYLTYKFIAKRAYNAGYKLGLKNRSINSKLKPFDLTDEQLKYLKENVGMCPFCRDEDSQDGMLIIIDQDEYLAGNTVFNMECNECGTKWNEVYTLVRAFKKE